MGAPPASDQAGGRGTASISCAKLDFGNETKKAGKQFQGKRRAKKESPVLCACRNKFQVPYHTIQSVQGQHWDARQKKKKTEERGGRGERESSS